MKLVLSLINKLVFFILFLLLGLILPLTIFLTVIQEKETSLNTNLQKLPIAVNLDNVTITKALEESIPEKYRDFLNPVFKKAEENRFFLQYCILAMVITLSGLFILTEQGDLNTKVKKTTLNLLAISMFTRIINLYFINVALKMLDPYLSITNIIPSAKNLLNNPQAFMSASNQWSILIEDIHQETITSINTIYKWAYGILFAVLLFTFVIPILKQVSSSTRENDLEYEEEE